MLPGKGGLALLHPLEKVALPVLPLSAGQLYSFVYDSTARPNELQQRFSASMRNVDAMLDDLLKYG